MRSIAKCSIALVALLILTSCGGDDSSKGPTDPGGKKTGNPNDAQFVITQQQITYVNRQSLVALQQVYSLVNLIGISGASGATNRDAAGLLAAQGLDYHEDSQYWLYDINYSFPYGTDTIQYTIIDSLQFLHGTAPVQYPESLQLTGVRLGYRWLLDYAKGDSLAYAMTLTMLGDPGAIANRGFVTIDGDGYFRGKLTAASTDLSCVYDYNFITDYDNLVYSLSDVAQQTGCPIGGALAHGGAFAVDCDGTNPITYGGEWNTNLSYAGESITYTYENETTTWSGTTDCGTATSAEVPAPFPPQLHQVPVK